MRRVVRARGEDGSAAVPAQHTSLPLPSAACFGAGRRWGGNGCTAEAANTHRRQAVLRRGAVRMDQVTTQHSQATAMLPRSFLSPPPHTRTVTTPTTRLRFGTRQVRIAVGAAPLQDVGHIAVVQQAVLGGHRRARLPMRVSKCNGVVAEGRFSAWFGGQAMCQ